MTQQRVYAVGLSKLTVQFGDILGSSAEVLVSSDDHLLSMGGGVSGAIARSAGSAIEVDAAKSVPCQLGDVVITTAGALEARHVFHVVTIGPQRQDDDQWDAFGSDSDALQMIVTATTKCLDLVAALGLSSIAFPALGAGVAQLPLETVAAGMAEAIFESLHRAAKPLTVELHLMAKTWQNDMDYIVFFEELARRLSMPMKALGATASVAAEVASIPDRRSDGVRRQILEIEAKRRDLELELAGRDGSASAEDEQLARQYMRATSDLVEAIAERRPATIFVSYSHKDKDVADRLVEHMSGLRIDGLATWHDRMISPGADWASDIHHALETADLLLFLTSASSLSSDYCVGTEWKRAKERYDEGTLLIVPVILSPCDWRPLLGHIQKLPAGDKTIADFPNRDVAYLEIVVRVRELIEAKRSHKKP